jgi:hypothetical protein
VESDVRDDRLPGQLRAGVVLVLIEAAAMVGLTLILLVKALTGHPHSLAGALLGAALALFVAAVLAVCARGLARLRPAARTPVVVLQLFALPVSYDLGIQAGYLGYGGPMLVLALATLYLLFTPPARAALDRDMGED